MKKHEEEKRQRLEQWKKELCPRKRIRAKGRIFTEFDQFGNRFRRYDYLEWVK